MYNYTQTCTHTHRHTHIHMHRYTYVCIHIDIHVYKCTHTRTHTQSHRHTGNIVMETRGCLFVYVNKDPDTGQAGPHLSVLSICMVRRYDLVLRCKSPSFLVAFHGGPPPFGRSHSRRERGQAVRLDNKNGCARKEIYFLCICITLVISM